MNFINNNFLSRLPCLQTFSLNCSQQGHLRKKVFEITSRTFRHSPILKDSQHAIHGFLKELPQWKNFFTAVTKDDLFKNIDNLSYIEWAEKARATRGSYWKDDMIRKPLLPASKEAIARIFGTHIPSSDSKILELGSNKLDSEGKSYLARIIPENHLPRIIYSDAFQSIVDQESLNTTTTYLHLDAKKLDRDLKFSPAIIIAINVFDVIKKRDLAAIATSIHRSLQDKGKVIILADQPICAIPLLDQHSDPIRFTFPYYKGIIEINLPEMREAISRIESSELKCFLNAILDLKPVERHIFLYHSWSRGLTICSFLALFVKEEKLCPQFYQHLQSYTDELTSAFAKNHFKIISSHFEKSTKLVKQPFDDDWLPLNLYIQSIQDPDYIEPNTICNDLRENQEQFSCSPFLEAGTLKLESNFHVFIAEKQ